MGTQTRWIWKAAAAMAGVLLAMQAVPGPKRENPPVQQWQTIEANLAVPGEVRAIVQRACKNCHSNETAWPWYAKIAPGSWLVARDVNKARRAMNLSRWTEGAGRSRMVAGATLAAACADVRSGRMPLEQYQLMHPESRLTKADQEVFCNWANQMSHELLTGRPGAKTEARVRRD